MSVIFSDNFNRADQTLTDSTNWTLGTGTSYEIVSNKAQSPVVAGAYCYYPATQATDCSVEADFEAGFPSLMLRSDAANANHGGTCYQVVLVNITSVRVREITGGGVANLGEDVADHTNTTIKLEATGATLKAYSNSTEIIDTSDATISGPGHACIGDAGGGPYDIDNFVFIGEGVVITERGPFRGINRGISRGVA